MDKEISNNSVELDVMEDGEAPPRGYKGMTAHKIFSVKLDTGFAHKSRLIADGHKVDLPP